MYFTLGQAAKEVGKSKGTLSNMIKNGKLSVAKKTDKGYQIDASELFRVFPQNGSNTVVNEQSTTPVKTIETLLLNKDIERLNEKIAMLEQNVENLESDKAYLQAELSKSSNLIADMRNKPPENPIEDNKKFFGIFSRKTD